MTASRPPSTTSGSSRRFLAGCLTAIGTGAAVLSYAWYYWFIRRQPGEWCGEQGFSDAIYNEAAWFPLGAECGYAPPGTHYVPDPSFAPAWEASFILLGGLAMIVIAIVIFVLTGARRRRAPVA
ncbi:MAG: hypothetical protein ABWY23_10640 [Mycetocola sp.]